MVETVVIRVSRPGVVVRPLSTPVVIKPLGVFAASSGTGVQLFEIQAFEAVAEGQAVFIRLADGNVALARADDFSTAQVFGIVAAGGGAAAGFNAKVLAHGNVALADWTTPTGAASLIRGRDYFLDPVTAGSITTTAPSTSGQFVTRVGRAGKADTLEVHVHRSIRKA